MGTHQLRSRGRSMLIEDKLTILADAAKYDASCASSGSRRRNSSRQLPRRYWRYLTEKNSKRRTP
jgi:hypothetical protein